MLKRVADIVADILIENNITDLFSLVGGGAMFLNDAFGHREELNVLYNQHEQACSMAAEGYVRATGKMAAVCVTTGPGGTNAITGVLGAYQDNYPMIVISGQVRYETTSMSTGLPLRFMGEQEHNIIDTVRPLTKYVVMVTKPEDIRYELEKAIWIATTGRKGPCWIDIPMNIQSGMIDSEELKSFVPNVEVEDWNKDVLVEELRKAKRPVILAGSALRSNGCIEQFRKLSEKLGIPILAATYNADLLSPEQTYYYGNFGINGGRAGNFMVQSADLIIGLGCRMTYRQIGYNYEAFSPNSRKVIVDVDENELKKPTLQIDVPICTDLKNVLDYLEHLDYQYEDTCGWIAYCDTLKQKFPVYLEKFDKSAMVNPYYFFKILQQQLSDDSIVVLGNSSIAGHVLQLGIQKPQQRIINNMNCGSMGYDLPAAIGAAVGVKKPITLVTGDGSIMLNIQELVTVQHYQIPLKIFICSNGGYRGIVRSQQNMFEGRYTGCTDDTGVAMPSFKKIAEAFDLPYFLVENHAQLEDTLQKVYQLGGACICEVMQDLDQVIEPRSSSRRLEDGSIVSPVIDDLFPFLEREIYEKMRFPIDK